MSNTTLRHRLEQAVGDRLQVSFEALSDADAEALATLLEDSRRQQQQALQKALEHALGYLPRLLRGPVRRVLFPKA